MVPLRTPRLARLVASVLAATLVTPRLRAQPSPTGSSLTALTAFADSLERTGFSGILVVADSQVVHLVRPMGYADRAAGRRLTREDVWRWASVTKQITAALVLREVDRGRIGLDTPVVRYLPTFGGADRARITVRHLLQHTSGLPNPEDGPRDADGVPRVYRETGREVGDEAFARICAGALTGPRGTTFSYNNCDYLVLGALLRERTGRSTAQLLRRALPWVPNQPQTVRGYPRDTTPEPPFTLAAYGSAGALTGTIDELVGFDRLLLSAWLSPAAKAELWRGDAKLGYAALGAWVFPATLRGCAAPVSLVERRGDILGVQARNVLVPSRGLAIIVLTNRGDVDFGEVWQGTGLMHDLLALALCAPTP